ncbi:MULTISPECIES: DUF2000 domain-containing protein [Thermomonospora]|uniref:DUF2000 domain-containing protein n=1 Tax=Thermomonospora cellulosilytica TaxID=1411118 RepID=A0A7W3MZH9_9ACTN|nr:MULTISPECIES: DUF2000 domain-containing protein [Thermomonospora]MBA9004749.1 hypothetical protein [Thermomonospora cellulosilytica]
MTVSAPAWLGTLERRPDLPTGRLPVKWVIVADRELPRGLQANAAACLAAAMGRAAPELVGDGGPDASGGVHTGLPWTGCTVLAATAPILRVVRAAALEEPDLLVADMCSIAQRARVYSDYLAELARTADEDLTYYAISVAGPRALVDRLTGRFPLLR